MRGIDGKPIPNERDRQTAARMVANYIEAPGYVNDIIEVAIAHALLEERERARAPFLVVAKQLENEWDEGDDDYRSGEVSGLREAAARIRSAAEETA